MDFVSELFNLESGLKATPSRPLHQGITPNNMKALLTSLEWPTFASTDRPATLLPQLPNRMQVLPSWCETCYTYVFQYMACVDLQRLKCHFSRNEYLRWALTGRHATLSRQAVYVLLTSRSAIDGKHKECIRRPKRTLVCINSKSISTS